jgi:hypothetical protein
MKMWIAVSKFVLCSETHLSECASEHYTALVIEGSRHQNLSTQKVSITWGSLSSKFRGTKDMFWMWNRKPSCSF